jgi:hypothetical protein
MKWYAYPLALVAWLLIAIFLFIITWNWLGELPNPEWYLYLPIGAAILVAISVGLSYLKFAWELEVLIQVVVVLGPLLWYLNLREPYRPPVYVFLIEAGYTGPARITFTNDEATKTQVRSTADTLFFRFNGEGEMVLNEDFRMVKDGMENRWYYLYPDGSRKKIEVVAADKIPANDSTRFVAVEDSLASDKGKIQFIEWKLQRADKH